MIGSTYLPPSSSILVVESHLSTIEQLLSSHKPDVVLLLGEYNMPCVSWTSATGDLTPASSLIIDSFSFLNLFQFNHITNCSWNILDLVVSKSKVLSVAKTTLSLIKPDPYHSPLVIQYHYHNLLIIDVTRSYFDFKTGDYSSIFNFIDSFTGRPHIPYTPLMMLPLCSTTPYSTLFFILYSTKFSEPPNSLVGYHLF